MTTREEAEADANTGAGTDRDTDTDRDADTGPGLDPDRDADPDPNTGLAPDRDADPDPNTGLAPDRDVDADSGANTAASQGRTGRRHRPWIALALLGVPVLAALLGPLLGPWLGLSPTGSTPSTGGALPSQPPDAGHPLGTDVLGRDVLWLILHGGASVLGSALGALLVGVTVGVPLGLLASGPRRGLDETVMRGLDLLLAFPGLLVLMTMAATGHRDWYWLVVVTGVLQVPAIARLVRGAALAPGTRSVVEALRMQGHSWAYVHLRHLARELAAPLATDAGGRFAVVLYLLASANFLGLGLPASSPDWAVLIERNSDALFTQPAAVLVPAGLLTALCVGGNLLVDRALAQKRRSR